LPQIDPVLIEDKPVVTETLDVTQEPVQLASPQFMAVPVSGHSNTYMFVTMDDKGVIHPMDGSMYPYDVQQGVPPQIYDDAASLSQTYPTQSSGQDILAEALANTNVLESDMVPVPDTSLSLQKPMMPSIISSGIQVTSMTSILVGQLVWIIMAIHVAM